MRFIFIYLMARISSNLHLLYRSLACKQTALRRKMYSEHISREEKDDSTENSYAGEFFSLAESGSTKSLISFAFYSRKNRKNKPIKKKFPKNEVFAMGNQNRGKLFNKLRHFNALESILIILNGNESCIMNELMKILNLKCGKLFSARLLGLSNVLVDSHSTLGLKLQLATFKETFIHPKASKALESFSEASKIQRKIIKQIF